MPRVITTLTLSALVGAMVIGAAPAAAQLGNNPFAGRPAGGLGPYGSDAGATMHLIQAGPLMRAGTTTAAAATGSAAATGESREMPHRAELREGTPLWEAMFVGCAAGAFLGGYTAWSTITPLAGAELAVVGTPAAGYLAGALGTGLAIGCGLGASTAAVTVAATAFWSWAFR